MNYCLCAAHRFRSCVPSSFQPVYFKVLYLGRKFLGSLCYAAHLLSETFGFLSWFASVFLICICFVKLRRLKLSWSPLGSGPRSRWSDNNRLHFHIDGRAPELYGSVFIFNTAAEFPHNYITNRATLSHHLPLMCSRNSRAVASHLFQMKWPMCASANPNSDASKKKKRLTFSTFMWAETFFIRPLFGMIKKKSVCQKKVTLHAFRCLKQFTKRD